VRLLRVKAHNFRSYSNVDLDLSPIESAVASGPIGSGKSALLVDLPLWVWFGRTRSKRADEFIKLGEVECFGEVWWESMGSRYRAVRSRSIKTKNGKSDLRLEIWLPDKKKWDPRPGHSISETEEKIVAALGMGYDALIASSYSPQGESDRFTNPPRLSLNGRDYDGPSARMQILAQLTGMTVYERLRVKAAETMGQVEGRVTALETGLAVEIERAATLTGLRSDLTGATENVALYQQGMDDIEKKRLVLDAKVGQLTAEVIAQRSSLSMYAQDEQRRTQVEARRGVIADRLKAAKTKIAGKATALVATGRLAGAQEETRTLEAALDRLTSGLATVNGRMANLATETETARRAHEEAVKTIREAQAEIKAQSVADPATVTAELVAVRAAVGLARQERDSLESRIKTLHEQVIALRKAQGRQQFAVHRLESARGQHAVRLHTAKESLASVETGSALLESVPCHVDRAMNTACKLLANARTAHGRIPALQQEVRDLEAWQPPADLTDEIAAVEREIADTLDCEPQSVNAENARKFIVTKVAALEAEEWRLSALDRSLAGVQAKRALLPQMEATANGTADRLFALGMEVGEQVEAQRDIRGRREQTVSALALSRAVVDLGDAATRTLAEIAQAETDVPGLLDEDQTLSTEAQHLAVRLADRSGKAAAIAEAERLLSEVTVGRDALAVQVESSRQIERKLLDAVAVIRSGITSAEDAEAKVQVHRGEIVAGRERIAVLKTLTDAYKQIPLMILENVALPFLEVTTNETLNRIARNHMSVRFETQRAVKKSEILADTLEIIVTDEVGTRTLESYSGGQKFQVDLAIRIALAKLQARRTGVRVDTMVIDEGFGTQDRETLGEIVEALRAIKEDFPLLIIVSHVEELKETFAHRIEVEGGPMDSHATLVLATGG